MKSRPWFETFISNPNSNHRLSRLKGIHKFFFGLWKNTRIWCSLQIQMRYQKDLLCSNPLLFWNSSKLDWIGNLSEWWSLKQMFSFVLLNKRGKMQTSLFQDSSILYCQRFLEEVKKNPQNFFRSNFEKQRNSHFADLEFFEEFKNFGLKWSSFNKVMMWWILCKVQFKCSLEVFKFFYSSKKDLIQKKYFLKIFFCWIFQKEFKWSKYTWLSVSKKFSLFVTFLKMTWKRPKNFQISLGWIFFDQNLCFSGSKKIWKDIFFLKLQIFFIYFWRIFCLFFCQ